MQLSAEDAPRAAGRVAFRGATGVVPIALIAALLVLVAVQRGGYYAESWGLPTAACGWILVLAASLGMRQRFGRLELAQIAALALVAALALISAAWAPGGLGSALPPTQLIVLYVAAVGAMLVLFGRATPFVVAIWVSLLAVCLIALGTRLFPTAVDTTGLAHNRLSEPLGYWNSLGLWAAMGLALGLVLAARSRSLALRAAAAAGCVPCAATLYFTFSRGAWVSLAVGLVVAFIFDPRRLGLAAWSMVTLPWPAVGVLLASRSHALTTAAPALGQARRDGHSLAIALLLLAAGGALAAVVAGRAEQGRAVPDTARRAFAALLVALCLLAGIGVTVTLGAPWTIATRTAHHFAAPPPKNEADLNARLFDASGTFRIDLWRVAWRDAERHPLVGSGAGSYAAQWIRHRPAVLDATNAHELYLETLAELGPLGLGLLLTALGIPLVAAWRARRHPLMAGVLAAYVAFLGHAALDWDWQLAAVGLAALACGAALLVMARGARSIAIETEVRRLALGVAGVAVAAFALWSLYGASPLGQARDAIDAGQWAVAEAHARQAASRIGGSDALPWQYLGEAQTALRKPGRALVSLRVATRRDPSSWQAWYDLAVVARGTERQRAARRALALNPLAPETRALAGVDGSTPSPP